MAREIKEVASIRTNPDKYAAGYDAIDWGKKRDAVQSNAEILAEAEKIKENKEATDKDS